MTDGYYGRPLLKAPVWKAYIPLYFFSGGLAGASSALALAAATAGNHRLARTALLTSFAGVAVSGPLLVADLGRPARFMAMLRVAKPTSPMSVGSWLLAVFGPASTVAAASEVTGRLPRLGRATTAVAGALGPVVSTYTAVLVADTAIPAWHDAYRQLPFVFAGSSAASAGGAAMALAPPDDAGPARRLAVLGAAIELGAWRAMESRIGRPYEQGRAGQLARLAEVCTAAGAAAAMAAGRRRPGAVAAGTLLSAGSLLTRFSVFRAGFESAADPAATIGPQRRRAPSSAPTREGGLPPSSEVRTTETAT